MKDEIYCSQYAARRWINVGSTADVDGFKDLDAFWLLTDADGMGMQIDADGRSWMQTVKRAANRAKREPDGN